MMSLQSSASSSVSFCTSVDHSHSDVDRILLESGQASDILRNLYRSFKEKQSKVSLGFICRSAGIPSKGYLALVMSGQRRLHAKYWDTIFKTFKLNDLQKEILRAQLELEQIAGHHSQAWLQGHIENLRDLLRSQA